MKGIVQDLTGPQIAILKALATHPTSKILSKEYMQAHRLSVGRIQYARKKLEDLDLIERHKEIWRIVDPVFGLWLTGY